MSFLKQISSLSPFMEHWFGLQVCFGAFKLISIRRKLTRKPHSKCTPIFKRDKRTKINLGLQTSLNTWCGCELMNLPYESDICDDFLLLKCRSQHEDSRSSNGLKSEVILEWNGKKILEFILSTYSTCWGWKSTWNTTLKMRNYQKIFIFNRSNVCTAASSYNRTNTSSCIRLLWNRSLKNKGKKILDTSTDWKLRRSVTNRGKQRMMML